MNKSARNKTKRTQSVKSKAKTVDFSKFCTVIIRVLNEGSELAFTYERPQKAFPGQPLSYGELREYRAQYPDDAILTEEAMVIFEDIKRRGLVTEAATLMAVGVARSLVQADEMGLSSARIFDSRPDAKKLLIKCYIEEYNGDLGLSARLREKDSGRHVKLGIETASQKAHFLKFLSTTKAKFSGSEVFSQTGLNSYVEVSGNLYSQNADEICVAYDNDVNYLVR